MMRDQSIKKIKTTTWSAGPGCHGGCGVIAHVQDGKLIKIEGNPEHPWNQGRLCARALAMTQYVENPLRLRKPLKRVGERGQDQWQEITWEEALNLIEKKMKAIRAGFGPESVIFSMGTGRDIGPWICLIAYAFGSPNVMFALSGNACYSPRIAALDTVQGDYAVFDAGQWFRDRYQDPRFKRPECMIIWGYNIPATCPDNLFGHWIIDMMKQGTRIISIDPRLSWFASRAKHWLQLRPGTDAALAMGFLNVIIHEKLFDAGFVDQWTNAPHLIREDTGKLIRASDILADGAVEHFLAWDPVQQKPVAWDPQKQAYLAKFKKPARSGRFTLQLKDGRAVTCHTVWDVFCAEVNQYPLDRVAEITHVSAETIAAAARFYAKSKPASIQWGVPIDMTGAITPLCQAMAALWALTGNLDQPGGNIFARFAFDAVAYALPGAEGVIKLKNKDQDKPRIGKHYGPFNKFIWRCQIDPDPVVEIHPDTAKEYNLSHGEWVWVENWMGRCKLKAKVTLIVPRWMVMAAHGWWFPERKGAEPELYGTWEHNINLLIPMDSQGKDGLGAPIKHSMCRIYKA